MYNIQGYRPVTFILGELESYMERIFLDLYTLKVYNLQLATDEMIKRLLPSNGQRKLCPYER